MQITNNLKDDILHAPKWFHESIQVKAEDLIHQDPLGNLSYSKWHSKTKNLIIFIHGTGAHKKWWDPIAPQLIEYSNVIAIDLPGMGNSGFRKEYKIKDFGDCITALINKEKIEHDIENVYIIGHSLGGHVAGYVASENKNLIDSIIIIDTFIRPPDYDPSQHTGPLRMIKFYPDKITILKRFRLMPKQECINDWYLRYIAEHSIKETQEGWRWCFDDLLFTNLERLFGYSFSFECPALFVHGKDSLLTSGYFLENIKNTYSNIMDFEEVSGAAHHVPLDKPIELVNIIKSRLF